MNSGNPSQILGELSANGQVILVNPNGVFFGKGSQVDVSGLIATTANIANNDFMAGNLNFSQPGSPAASVVNQGTITAKQAGLVGFVAPSVENDGVITAKLGKVTLASGDTFTLDLYGDGLMEVAVSDAVVNQAVSNTGTIQADGGTVTLTAAAVRNAVNSLITNSGAVQANAIATGPNGEVILYAASGTVENTGNLSAKGGTVQMATGTQSGNLVSQDGQVTASAIAINGDAYQQHRHAGRLGGYGPGRQRCRHRQRGDCRGRHDQRRRRQRRLGHADRP